MLGQALPAEHDALAVVAHLRSEGAIFRHAMFSALAGVRYSALGRLNERLKKVFLFWSHGSFIETRRERQDLRSFRFLVVAREAADRAAL